MLFTTIKFSDTLNILPLSKNISFNDIIFKQKCNKCNEIKFVGDFTKRKNSKNGIDTICKKCNYLSKKRYPPNPNIVQKKCNTCNLDKDINNFYKDSSNPDGYNYKCIECRNNYENEYHNRTPESINKYKNNSKKSKQRTKLRSKIIVTEKYCGGCKSIKNVEDFNKNICTKDGFNDICKECSNEYNKKRTIFIKSLPKVLIDEKYCYGCNETYKIKAFSKNITTYDGYELLCKGCRRKYNRDSILDESEFNKPTILYFIKFKNKQCKNVEFVKIGITTLSIKIRYSGYDKNWDYEILNILYFPYETAIELESRILVEHDIKDLKYIIPETLIPTFRGHTECVSKLDNYILNKFNIDIKENICVQ